MLKCRYLIGGCGRRGDRRLKRVRNGDWSNVAHNLLKQLHSNQPFESAA
jgi:hypothetical protein